MVPPGPGRRRDHGEPDRHRNAIDFAVMLIDTYNPWCRYYCNPEEAWRMGNDAGRIVTNRIGQEFQLT